MSPTKLLLACAIAAAAVGAHAAPTYSVAAPTGSYGISPYVAVGTAGIATASDNNHATPTGLTEGSPYFYTSFSNSSLTVGVNASAFTFLWGSPDTYNSVTYETSLGNFTYTGTQLASDFGIVEDGKNSTSFTASLAGGVINDVVFKSSDIAFEFAVAQAVPEPETYALLAGGLLAVGFMVRRSKR